MRSTSLLILCAFGVEGNDKDFNSHLQKQLDQAKDELKKAEKKADQEPLKKNLMDDLVDHLVDRLIGRVVMPNSLAGVAQTFPSMLKAPGASGTSMLSPQLRGTSPSEMRTGLRSVAAKSELNSGETVAAMTLAGLAVAGGIPAAAIFGVPAPWVKGINKELKFDYKPDVNFDYDEVPASKVAELMDKGWTLLDVRNAEQVQKMAVRGATAVPLYVQRNDFKSPYGLYQEGVAFGLGGWWMGGRPMKENHDFVHQVEEKVSKTGPGIIAVCQSGLRAKQALKELHAAGYPRLALIEGGLRKVKPGDIPCVDDEYCDLAVSNSGNIAGMLGWRS